MVFTISKALNWPTINYETKEKHIDILIGGDYFYTFVGGNVIRGTSGPVGVETSFGYTLSGGLPPQMFEKESTLARTN